MIVEIHHALMSMRPDAEFVIDENGLTWMSNDIPQPTEAEIEAKIAELQTLEPLRLLREERDRLIAETDFWVLPDRTPTQEQLDYRQALRDITDTYSSLEDVVWPVKP
jgi:hypothetical protein